MIPDAVIRVAESAPVTQWGSRLVLTAVVLAIIGLGVWGMRQGWAGRAARQADVAEPGPVPVGRRAPEGSAVPGMYVATTTAGDLLDRIVAHGLGNRGRARLSIHDDGVLVERTGERPVWIPRTSLRAVRLGSGQAQKAYEAGGLILIAWQLGERTVETGFRADDPDQHVATAQQLSLLVADTGGIR